MSVTFPSFEPIWTVQVSIIMTTLNKSAMFTRGTYFGQKPTVSTQCFPKGGNLMVSLHMPPAQGGIQILGKNTDDFKVGKF